MRLAIGVSNLLVGMETVKRSDKWWRVRICSLPIVLNSDAGAGLCSASASILAASAALLTDDVVGMAML